MHELPGLHLEPVLSRPDSALWNEYIDRYHYLGYKPLPGAQLRYFACSESRILALLGFGAAAWKTAPRDRFIGWRPSERERNLQLIVNNARFLILPWVQSKNLASKVLAMATRQLPEDWHDRYVAVGTILSDRPPHRSQRAELPHWALTSGNNAQSLFGIRV